MSGDWRRPGRAKYRDSALLTIAAVLPAVAVMFANDWSARAPLDQVFGAVALGIMLWAAVIVLLRHPIRDEATILLRKLKRQDRTLA